LRDAVCPVDCAERIGRTGEDDRANSQSESAANRIARLAAPVLARKRIGSRGWDGTTLSSDCVTWMSIALQASRSLSSS
jgi:hypothetical protein